MVAGINWEKRRGLPYSMAGVERMIAMVLKHMPAKK